MISFPSSSMTLPAIARRSWEWIWRSRAMASARARRAERSYVRACEKRARITTEVGERSLDPSVPFSAGSASHLVVRLFAEAIGWWLRAAENASGAAGTPDFRPPDQAELRELASAQRALLTKVVGDDAALHRVLEYLLEPNFGAGDAPPPETEAAARELGKVSRALERALATSEDDLDTLYFERLVRVGLSALVLLASIAGILALRERLDEKDDISLGKPWTVSSSYDLVCRSPEHDCAAKVSYFFHTQLESDPWFEIDLQKELTFSRVHAFNRRDCCAERAVPLVIEVSLDHTNWREVTRKTESFDAWKAKFASVRARYVRLRVARSSILHLWDVRVLK